MVLEAGQRGHLARGNHGEMGPGLRRHRPHLTETRTHGPDACMARWSATCPSIRWPKLRRNNDRPWVPTPSRRLSSPDAGDLPAAWRHRQGRSHQTLMGSPNSLHPGAGSGNSTTTWSWPTPSTKARPGGDAAVVRVHGTGKARSRSVRPTAPRAMCVAGPGPAAVAQAVAESWRNLTGGRRHAAWPSPTT